MNHTIFDACLDATHEIWDDREAYILAVLEALKIDPEANYDEYLLDLKEPERR